MLQDGFNRRVNYLRVSLTEGCNLRCVYCMPESGGCARGSEDALTTAETRAVAEAALRLGVDKIRLTGGEPLIRRDILSLVAGIGEIGGLRDFAMTTNGALLAGCAADLKRAGLHRVNVSLDTLDAEKYERLTRGGRLSDVLNGLERAKAAGLTPVKVNAVLIGGENDGEIRELARLVTDGLADELRFIELMPIGETASWPAERFISSDVVRETLDLRPAENSDPSSTSRTYEMPGGGRVGLIAPMSHKFCGGCNRVRLTADGCLKPCLLCGGETDVKPCLRQGRGSLEDLLLRAAAGKPRQHALDNKNSAPSGRNMARIGG